MTKKVFRPSGGEIYFGKLGGALQGGQIYTKPSWTMEEKFVELEKIIANQNSLISKHLDITSKLEQRVNALEKRIYGLEQQITWMNNSTPPSSLMRTLVAGTSVGFKIKKKKKKK
jgi:hypothetical protein